MNRLISLVFVFACFVAACGGKAVIDAELDESSDPSVSSSSSGGGSIDIDMPDFVVWREDGEKDRTVPGSGGQFESMMQIRFTAEETSTLNALAFRHEGFSIEGAEFYLYNEATPYLQGSVGPSDLVTFDDLHLTVVPGETRYYTVYAAYNASVTSTGTQHQLKLESAEMIDVTEEREIVGEFPIVSARHTLRGPFDGVKFVATYNASEAITEAVACSKNAVLFPYIAESWSELQIQSQNFRIEGIDGALVLGSKGTPYFENVRLVNLDSQQTYMGPTELIFPSEEPTPHVGFISLGDFFTMGSRQTIYLAIVADIQCVEDLSGEFFGRSYRVVKHPANGTEIFDLSSAEPVSPSETWPQGDLVGKPFAITAP